MADAVWLYVKIVLACTIVLLMYKMFLLTVFDPSLNATVKNQTPEEIEITPINIEKQVKRFVHDMINFKDKLIGSEYDNTPVSSSSATHDLIRLRNKRNKRTLKQVIWENSDLYFHKIQYNFDTNATRPSLPSGYKFGKVTIAYNKSREITTGTVELSNNVYIAPSDYICIHTPVQSDKAATVVLATTMFFNDHTFLLNNTIKNWSRFRPYLQPVLYVTPTKNQPHAYHAVRHACSLGWDVYIVPESNPNNFPVLRTMMADLLHKYSAPIIGYANGDILFDNTLPETLQFFHKYKDKFLNKIYHLITGRRKDVLVSCVLTYVCRR